mgnify:CR=1 FL=1
MTGERAYISIGRDCSDFYEVAMVYGKQVRILRSHLSKSQAGLIAKKFSTRYKVHRAVVQSYLRY